MKKIEKDCLKLEEGNLLINEKLITIPSYKLINELGNGANATVFRAYDENLRRDVAIKIWNNKGRFRAQDESIKIASFKHPLVVETYHFNIVEGYPYAVMELVPGESGKKWLKTPQSLNNRIAVWRLYSQSLLAIYTSDRNHGDPHLGNVLITQDINQNVSIKLADAGTSDFRGDKDALMARESKILYETACKLFPEFSLKDLWIQPKNVTYTQALELINSLVDFLGILNDKSAYDWAAQVASKLVDIVYKAPLFKIKEMDRLIKEHISISGRFKLYLNRRLLNGKRDDVRDEYYEITSETLDKYKEMQSLFLNTLERS